MNDLIGKTFKVLNDGHIRVVDVMGDDNAIVQAARISYGKGTKKSSEDRHLIRYLMRHRHTTPFEMCELKLHVRVPMDCWRQWIRHRTASVNEYSTRYSEAIDARQTTNDDKWRAQAAGNKQGSGEFLDEGIGNILSRNEALYHTAAQDLYQGRIDCGVAKEQARKDLPLSTYTEAYWKIDLHNLMHFLGLRMDGHAQSEIRQYATIIGEQILAEWCPVVWEAFQDYRLNAMYLSASDIATLKMILKPYQINALKVGFERYYNSGNKLNREGEELKAKADRLGLIT